MQIERSFEQYFESVIDKNDSFKKATKMQYLLALLGQVPLDKRSHLEKEEENYKQSVDTLKKTHDKPELIMVSSNI
jgi:Protein of unknown function (DUF1759)